MTEQDQKKIFAKNLNHYLDMAGKPQREVAEAIDVSPQTFNTWCQAIAIPRMDKIQKLADYFGIHKSDLVDEHQFGKYYFDEATAQMAQRLYDDEHTRMLFDVAQDAKPEDLDMARDILLALRKKEEPNTDE